MGRQGGLATEACTDQSIKPIPINSLWPSPSLPKTFDPVIAPPRLLFRFLPSRSVNHYWDLLLSRPHTRCVCSFDTRLILLSSLVSESVVAPGPPPCLLFRPRQNRIASANTPRFRTLHSQFRGNTFVTLLHAPLHVLVARTIAVFRDLIVQPCSAIPKGTLANKHGSKHRGICPVPSSVLAVLARSHPR